MSDQAVQIISGLGGAVAGAILGFLAAYIMASVQRHWDAEDAATRARDALIQKARVPLVIIPMRYMTTLQSTSPVILAMALCFGCARRLTR